MIGQIAASAIQCLIVGAAIVLVVSLIAWLRPRFRTIREEERWVIYRMGRLKGQAGPGVVVLWGGFDKVGRVINVRRQPGDFTAANVLCAGIPVTLVVNQWYRFDPGTAADGNRDRLADMLRFTDEERHQQMQIKLRDSLLRRLAAIDMEHELSKSPDFFVKLAPVLTGLDLCNRLLGEVRDDIRTGWRQLGIILDQEHPLIITNVQLPFETADAFGRGRLVDLLRRQFPDLPDRNLAQLAATIEGRKLPDQNVVVDGNRAGDATIEQRAFTDEGQRRVIVGGPRPLTGAAAGSAQSASPEGDIAGPAPAPRLSEADMQVLKKVPRPNKGQQASA